MGKPNRAVWVSRDKGSMFIDVWTRKPKWVEDRDYFVTPRSNKLPEEGTWLAQITGLSLKPGELKRVRFSVEVLE